MGFNIQRGKKKPTNTPTVMDGLHGFLQISQQAQPCGIQNTDKKLLLKLLRENY